MGRGPRYRVAMRRRREGRTNYQRRLKMVLSGKPRLVIRSTLKTMIVQIAEAKIDGDIIIAAADSKELKKKFDWKYNPGNMPSAYLTGYLCGLRATKTDVKTCILDIGIMIHKNRVLSAFRGFLDASGIEVPYKDKFFKKANLDGRINGEHIENYAKMLSKDDKETYEKKFSKYIANKADPKKIVKNFEKTKKLIEKEV